VPHREDGVFRGESSTRTRDVEAPDRVGHDGRLAADERDARPFRALLEPGADLLCFLVVGFFHGEVVDEGDRFDARGDEVVDVHRHAIDADGRVVVDGFCDEEFRPDAVRREREVLLADVDESGVVSLELALRRRSARPSPPRWRRCRRPSRRK